MVTKEMLDKAYEYYKRRGVNIDNPITLQDKLHWLQVYDVTPLKTICADKIKVKEYVKNIIHLDLGIPTLAVYDNVKQIEWNKLPNSFVIKCNHGSGMNFVVHDKSKTDLSVIERKLDFWMKDDFAFRNGYELHYHDIPHKIMVEPLLTDSKQTKSLFDYKFWCFNGEPMLYTINDGIGHGDIMYYRMDGSEYNLYGVKEHTEYQKPHFFTQMKEISKVLAKPFLFVRVDFYEVNDKLYLGEMTFIPGAGNFHYKNKEDDIAIGKWLKLPKTKA